MKTDKIANCTFAFKCSQTWQKLSPTKSDSIRFCNVCDDSVYLAEDAEAFGMLSMMGRCVAVRDEQSAETYADDELGVLLGIPSNTAKPDWPLFLECAHEELRGNAPGCVLNNNEPGSDGNYYSIERNADIRNHWDLFQCVPQYFFAPGFRVSPVLVGVTVEELYARIEAVDIFIQGHEAIALGLPFHGDNY